MKSPHTLLLACLLIGGSALSQSNITQSLSVNPDGTAAHASAQLDVSASDKGMLVPRLTTAQRTAVAAPATGLLVFDTTTGSFWFYGGTAWANLSTPKTLQDADADTKIQVEEATDEDRIRFDLAGTERWVMNAARLEPANSGQSVFIGQNAGAADDLSANLNAAIGHQALRFNTTGEENTVIGAEALYTNTVGLGNTAGGRTAMYYNVNGDYNTAIGYQALFSNTSGFENTAIGNAAMYYNTGGFGNTAIGSSASFTGNNLQNTTCIGYLAGGVSSANNRIEVGNTSVSFIGGQVNWSTYSDARIKTQVQENVPGLAFISKLRPVTYHLDIHRQNELCLNGKKALPDWPSKYDIEQRQMTGFIAQEVEQAAKAVGYDFSGVEKAADEVGMYSVRYSEFVVPLVKGMQEQQAKIEELENENAALKSHLERIEAALRGAGISVQNH